MFKLFLDEDATSPTEYSILLGIGFVVATAAVIGPLGEKLQAAFQRVSDLFPN